MKKRKVNLRRELGQYLGIVLGALIFGMGYAWFLVPYKIVPGGVGGIAQLFNHFLGFPVGLTMIAINIPLFVISFIFIGRSFGSKSLFGMLASSIMTDLLSLPSLFKMGLVGSLEPYTHYLYGKTIHAMLAPSDIYLSAIAGSVLLGLGLGIIFRFRGSTGGTDIPVALIKQKAGLSIGTGYWLVESIIILGVGIIMRDLKLVIWGFLNLFISTKITDLASEGLPYVKGVYVISELGPEIKQEIFERLDRGVTFFKGTSGYENRDIDILFCVVNRRQVPELTDIVKDLDKDAFMIVTDVHDVMGYGFRSRQLVLKDH